MHALVHDLTAVDSLQIVDRPAPRPRTGEVLLELIAGGLCHTDVSVIRGVESVRSGYHPPSSYVMGHEWVGRVVAHGEGVDMPAIGSRVVGGAHISCRRCRWCLSGRSMLCDHLDVMGLDTDGGWAERFTAPARNVVSIPDDMPLELAVLAEPFAVAVHGVDLAEIAPGDRIAVIGPGTVGLLTLGALAGHEVTVIGRPEDSEQLEAARRLGAAHTLTTIDALAQRGTFDVAFETAGAGPAVELAVDLVGRGGRVVCIGLPSSTASIDTAELARSEKRLIGSRAYDLSTWARIPKMLAAAPDLAELVTHRVPLSAIDQAIELVESHRATKVMLVPDPAP